MIGTWYFDHYSTADGLMLSESEFDRCLRQINRILPDVGVTAEDISFIHLGLVPVDKGLNKKDFKLKKHHCLIEHERYGGPDKLLSVLGVKYTTARSVAKQTIDLISKKISRKLNSTYAGNQPLAGGDIEDITRFIEEKKERDTNRLTEKTVRHLSLNYGTILNKIEALITAEPELGEFIPGSGEAIKAELPYCTRNEFVFHLSDFLFRRTGIGAVQKPKDETITFCADFLAAELGWSEPQKQDEINAVRRYYNRISNERGRALTL
jgi:glycerol-3-phosphate dehydrogenase